MNTEDFNVEPATLDTSLDLKASLLADFDKATCLAGKLAEVQIPPRAPIVGNWLMAGDLGFIFGARGLGKTWLAMLLARRIQAMRFQKS